VPVTEHPATDIPKSLVECYNIATCRNRVGGGGRGRNNRSLLPVARPLDLPPVRDHVVSKLLPENNTLSLAVIVNVLAGQKFSYRSVRVRMYPEALGGDANTRQALLAVVLIKVNPLGHGDDLVSVQITRVLAPQAVPFGTVNQQAGGREHAVSRPVLCGYAPENASDTAVV
jgi:hypothetical protein